MNEELTAKEILQILGEICDEHKCYKNCPFAEEFGDYCDHKTFGENFEKVIEICKEWKANHSGFETEWAHVCKIIKDAGHKKECVYEKEIDEDEILPFSTYDGIAEKILKKYCANHNGNFFATVERICRRVVK